MEIESVPKGLFGKTNFTPRFERAFNVVLDKELFESFLRFKFATEIFEVAEENVKNEIYRIFMEALGMVEIPSSTREYFKRLLDDEKLAGEMTKSWEPPNFPVNSGIKLDGSRKMKIVEASKFLMDSIQKISKGYKMPFKVYAMGHAHIDYAWLWPLKETKRKMVRTFANALRLLKKYPSFRFVQSSSAYYEDIKSAEPEIFKEIKKFVEDGRWEMIGGSVVEFDANLPSGESLSRQFLYGQKFFEREFGKKAKIAFLPDSFGFTWALPQIMKESGIKYFMTTKLSWNDKNKFPYSWFTWRGLDGTKIISHLFESTNGYNAPLIPRDLEVNWKTHEETGSRVPFSLVTFGYGDGGGGPTDEMMERYEYIKKLPALPELEIKSFEEVFDPFRFEDLPVIDDELYLEFHRGTYTNQARMKKLNREMESILYTAETIFSCSALENWEYPYALLTNAWKALLKSQFHDVLPGSSIGEVYEEFGEMVGNAKKEVVNEMKETLRKHAVRKINALSVFNPTNLDLPILVRNLPKLKEGIYGNAIIQNGKDGKGYILGEALMEGLKPENLEKTEELGSKPLNVWHHGLENDLVKVEVKSNGSIDIYDKVRKRSLFKNGLKLVMLRDIHAGFEAWDIPCDTEKRIVLLPEKVEVFDRGPAFSSLKFVYGFEGSRMIMIVRVYKDFELVDFDFDVDWHTRRYLLKMEFDANVLTREATFETAFGLLKRKTTRNNSYEQAKFEVPCHRWIDISQEDFGVSVINDGKYGVSVYENEVGLSLLRGAISSDFYSDEGKHEFTISILPHGTNWKANTLKHAILLNLPIQVIEGEMEDFAKGVREMFEKNENVVLTALKRAEESDEYVLRFYEPFGRNVNLKFNDDVILSSILEEKTGQRVREVDFEPFKIHTVVVKQGLK